VCSDGENPFEPNTFTYTVDPAGSVTLIEADGYTTHCQLAQRGALLLCDGTGGLGGVRNPETLVFLVVAAKL
jgi:hypothetical protein